MGSVWVQQQQQRGRVVESEDRSQTKMARRTTREPAAAVVLMLLLAAATAAAAAEEEALPMEAYFSAAELARIAGYGEEPVSSVSVSGQLTCELCLRPGSPLLALEMAGEFFEFLALFLVPFNYSYDPICCCRRRCCCLFIPPTQTQAPGFTSSVAKLGIEIQVEQ
jgi:hypothetical protein